ncbi:protein THEMIS [Rhinophrynus dorsalis]
MTTSLEKFIETLDPKSLPRVLQIQSGIYYGGSIYELSGNECSISTGEVIKVIGFKVKKVIANICKRNDFTHCLASVELPLDFPGLFKVVADKCPYYSIEELIRTLNIGPRSPGHPGFYSHRDLHVANLTISKDEPIMIRSVEEVKGVMSVNCEAVIKGQLHSFNLPLAYQGEFYERQDDIIYTLKEILDLKIPRSRNRSVILTDVMGTWEVAKLYNRESEGTMILKPVYEIQIMMQFRKDVVYLQPDLDIEVMDITQNFDMNSFIQVMTIKEVFERTAKEFPIIAEIIENSLGKFNTCSMLLPGRKIIIHKKYQASQIVASELRSNSLNKHFLIPSTYKGRFKRKPRFFPTVYDLKIAKTETEDLHVVATKSFSLSREEFSSVCVGDQFLVKHIQTCEIKYKGKNADTDVLTLIKLRGKSHEQVNIPLYVEGGFMEVVYDKKKYNISELCTHFQLPFNVKVSVRDLFTMGEDNLASTTELQLEEQITDSYLLVSPFDSPQDVWELPVHRLDLSVHIIGRFQGEASSLPTRTNIEEINEDEYYMVRRYENHVQYPPPRPPKTPLHSSEASETKSIRNPELPSSKQSIGVGSEVQDTCPEGPLNLCRKISGGTTIENSYES